MIKYLEIICEGSIQKALNIKYFVINKIQKFNTVLKTMQIIFKIRI